jgi:hypothetical protein
MEMEQDMRKLGYDKEEEYFFKLNQKLIEEMRKKRDSERAEQKATAGESEYWMRCPKCGSILKETDLLGIKVERCDNCQGVFFDKGELEILLKAQEPKGFLSGLRRVFQR